MNWAFVRREWGAVTFILTVVVGMVVVPLALFFANQGPGALVIPPSNTSSHAASPAHTSSPTPSPSKSPTPSPSK